MDYVEIWGSLLANPFWIGCVSSSRQASLSSLVCFERRHLIQAQMMWQSLQWHSQYHCSSLIIECCYCCRCWKGYKVFHDITMHTKKNKIKKQTKKTWIHSRVLWRERERERERWKVNYFLENVCSICLWWKAAIWVDRQEKNVSFTKIVGLQLMLCWYMFASDLTWVLKRQNKAKQSLVHLHFGKYELNIY